MLKKKEKKWGQSKKYGTTWQKIYKDNKDKIGSNPNFLRIGTTLVIK